MRGDVVARAFKVRSPERDSKTDHERLQALGQAISSALDGARREKEALKTRVDEARDLASFAAGTGVDEYLDREPRELARVREYERQMAQGDRRLSELSRQLEGLGKIRDIYQQFFGSPG